MCFLARFTSIPSSSTRILRREATRRSRVIPNMAKNNASSEATLSNPTGQESSPAYFNYDVQPETILRYIKEEGLPATQRGRLYFIEVEDLFGWQLRRSDKAD